MKKRFTLMMMVLCFLMSIPLKMMAEKVTVHYINEKGWADVYAYVYKAGAPIGDSWPGKKCKTFKTVSGNNVATWELDLGAEAASGARIIFNGGDGKPQTDRGGFPLINNQYYNFNGTTTDPSQGGSGTGGSTGGTTTEKWNTVTENHLTDKPRVYSQGFYLAGNFFTFDTEGINYNDAVFKFQQQKDQSIAQIAETPYDVYMVEIPASLTAQAQVMYVDANGNKTGIFGPGTANKTIDKGTPATGGYTDWAEITANESSNLLDNAKNYWDFQTRNESSSEYSDGLYEVYIAVDKNTHEPAKWMITHIVDKRVAYFISDAPDATAMPLYDAFISDDQGGRFGNKFFATVDLAANRSYYVISNYVRDSQDADKAQSYGAFNPMIHATSCPTTNKLFLQGNGGLDFTGNYPDNLICPNLAPLKVGKNNWGIQIVEYNPSRGKTDAHGTPLGFCGDLQLRNDRKVLTSVSLVGDAIPGTLNADGTWNYKSNVSDMIYDETEQCYKATVVTTAEGYGKPFRFVGNRDPQITWYENTNTDKNEMAQYPYKPGDTSAPGHTADANDPNKVNYTENGDPTSADYNSWNIIWNRPAGRWTVRLFFYTTSDGNNPKTDYYYTITASRDMELYDISDIVYGSETNKQNIYNKGKYKFLRTWSAKMTTWKISNKVDVFVVTKVVEDESAVKLTLKNINKFDETGKYHIIPAETGVILATTSAASEIAGAHFVDRQNYTSYNKLVIPMEENESKYVYEGTDNLLLPIYSSKVIPASDDKNFNYFFAYYNARKATNDETYGVSDYLLGFWISKGSKPYPGNSSYLPIPKDKAETMNRLGTSYNDFYSGGSAKKVPGVIFDFDNVGGSTTGINEVVNQSTKLNDSKYYTLSGQQVEKPTAGGIYIHNGRKFVVK